MRTRHSKCVALVVALGLAAFGGVGCNDDDANAPAKATFVTVDRADGEIVAFSYSASQGYHFARVAEGESIQLVGSSHAQYFTGSVSGSGSFSGSVGGSTSFSGSVADGGTYSGTVAEGGAFSGSAISAVCDFSGLCAFAEALCNALDDESCAGFSVSECYTTVNSDEFYDTVAAVFESDEATASFFCAFVNYLTCYFQSGADTENGGSAAEACLTASGLDSLYVDTDDD